MQAELRVICSPGVELHRLIYEAISLVARLRASNLGSADIHQFQLSDAIQSGHFHKCAHTHRNISLTPKEMTQFLHGPGSIYQSLTIHMLHLLCKPELRDTAKSFLAFRFCSRLHTHLLRYSLLLFFFHLAHI